MSENTMRIFPERDPTKPPVRIEFETASEIITIHIGLNDLAKFALAARDAVRAFAHEIEPHQGGRDV